MNFEHPSLQLKDFLSEAFSYLGDKNSGVRKLTTGAVIYELCNYVRLRVEITSEVIASGQSVRHELDFTYFEYGSDCEMYYSTVDRTSA